MRHLFIGSSKEGIEVAKKLKKILEEKLPDFLECDIWNDGNIFSLNKGTLDSLVRASRKYDYGILVATADDIRKSRGRKSHIPRDNVMFEMGMFLGSLGLSRAFLLVEKNSTLPTDYNGVTVPFYDKDLYGDLERAINDIIKAITNTVRSFNLRPLPSAALALSYFENFIQHLARKRLKRGIKFSLKILLPTNLSDIKTTIIYYKSNNPSEEISVYEDGARPIVNKYAGEGEDYWDIPTNLSTLYKLINIVSPSHEIGIEKDKQDWIDYEVRNFKGTLEILIAECVACKGSIEVQIMN